MDRLCQECSEKVIEGRKRERGGGGKERERERVGVGGGGGWVATCGKLHLHNIKIVANTEATVRFLKAKLRVMQEEMDRLCQECSEKVATHVIEWGGKQRERERERKGHGQRESGVGVGERRCTYNAKYNNDTYSILARVHTHL